VFVQVGAQGKRLRSLPEIALREFDSYRETRTLYRKKVRDVVTEQIKQGKKREQAKGNDLILSSFAAALPTTGVHELLQRHSYICFVKSDGDGLGKRIAAIGDDLAKLRLFQQKISGFARYAAPEIAKFGGMPVYMGGDDLLFIAPVVGFNGQSIFELTTQLNQQFKVAFGTVEPNEWQPTLRFGIAIAYYKYPMAESIKVAEQLCDRAKPAGGNTTMVRVMKHSGFPFEGELKNDSLFYQQLRIALPTQFGQDRAFLSSIAYKLETLATLLFSAIADNTLAHFFKNHFNEEEHRKMNGFLKHIEQMIGHYGKEYLTATLDEATREMHRKNLYSALRLIQFIHAKAHD
jgi:CRISPR-associated protein Cmr2